LAQERVDIVAEDVPDGISAEDHGAGLSSSLQTSPPTWSGNRPIVDTIRLDKHA